MAVMIDGYGPEPRDYIRKLDYIKELLATTHTQTQQHMADIVARCPTPMICESAEQIYDLLEAVDETLSVIDRFTTTFWESERKYLDEYKFKKQ